MKFHLPKFNVEIFLFLLLLGYVIIINNKSFYYDEPYYLDNVRLLNQLGFSKDFLLNMGGPAGPLHAFFFWLFQPLTANNVVLIRLVNPFFLLITIVISRKIYNLINCAAPSETWALGLMFIPMVYVCAGMALTEMPALCMLTFSLYFLLKSDLKQLDYRIILSGIFLSLAILGRQPYLLIIVPVAIWIWLNTKKDKLLNTFVFIISSVIFPLIAFIIWNGLAPHKGGDLASKDLISIPNLFLGFGYGSLAMLFINRNFFIPLKKSFLIYIFFLIIIIIAICFAIDFGQPLMKTTMQKIIPSFLFSFYEKITASVLALVAIYFITSLLYQIKINITNTKQLLFLVCLGIMLASCANITHQFSSRYVFQASIFMVFAPPAVKKDRLQIALGIIGAFVGMISLISYLYAN